MSYLLCMRARACAQPGRSGGAQAQQISLNFHCKCEQFVHFATGSFFNFNGTAGAQLPRMFPQQHEEAETVDRIAYKPLLLRH